MRDPDETLLRAVVRGTAGDVVRAAVALGSVWTTRGDTWTPTSGTGTDAPPPDAAVLDAGGQRVAIVADDHVVALVRAGLARVAAEEGRRAAESRLDLNERIAGMGSYDWQIAEDSNRWSDELYRIYGHEPGSFNASYERFLSLVHPDDRERIRAVHERAYGTGEPYEMEERIVRPDGSVRTLWSNGVVVQDEDGVPTRMVGVCRDVTEQLEADRLAAAHRDRARDAELLRRQALELNDNVVQGLAAVVWAIDDGAPQVARQLATETLGQARAMMHELLAAADGPLRPGALVRDEPTGASLQRPDGPLPAREDRALCRVVLADDAEDLRIMLRVALESAGDIEVVGEAGDGAAAVELVTRTMPDVVLLDVSMPVMDGLEVAAAVRATLAGTRIVVLSGWAGATMGDEAMAAGADAYVEKGASIADIRAAVLGEREPVH